MKLRPNIMILASYVFLLILLLVAALGFMIFEGVENDFLQGALIGLIGTGITALNRPGEQYIGEGQEQRG